MGFDEATDDDICFKSEGVESASPRSTLPLLDAVVMTTSSWSRRAALHLPQSKDPNYVPPRTP